MALRRLLYRARQFRQARTATPTPEELAEAQKILTVKQWALFSRLQPSEQAHSLLMLRRLTERGETHPDLLSAALLHDIGKSCYPLRTWERVAIVVGNFLVPGLMRRWGNQPGAEHSWRRFARVARKHPAWGAEMAKQAGVSPLGVNLIRRHAEKIGTIEAAQSLENRLLAQLQSVDDES